MRAAVINSGWWLVGDGADAENVEMEEAVLNSWPRELQLFDVLRFCGVLLPLPSTILFAERLGGNRGAASLLGLFGLCCTGFAGLLERRAQRWHPFLLQLLSVACAALGAGCAIFDCELVVLSAALLASVDVRASALGCAKGTRTLLSSSFAVGHLIGATARAVGFGSRASGLAALTPLLYSDSPEARSALGFLAGALAILLLRPLRQLFAVPCTAVACLLLSGMCLPLSAWLLLLPESVPGLPVALWWLAACEAASAALGSLGDRLPLLEELKALTPAGGFHCVRGSTGGCGDPLILKAGGDFAGRPSRGGA